MLGWLGKLGNNFDQLQQKVTTDRNSFVLFSISCNFLLTMMEDRIYHFEVKFSSWLAEQIKS